MLIKILLIGKNWRHEDRHREAKINHSLSVCPLYLLFKDHKGWSGHMGGPPPTRGIASASSGQNSHLSEIVSLFIEPVVNAMKGGMEQISTPDTLSKIDEVNAKTKSQSASLTSTSEAETHGGSCDQTNKQVVSPLKETVTSEIIVTNAKEVEPPQSSPLTLTVTNPSLEVTTNPVVKVSPLNETSPLIEEG